MNDPGSTADMDTIQRFASDLRRLRLEAKSPTLARLQDETGISRSVLSEAFAGRQLPSARTVDGIVRVCGGEPSEWIDRRDALAGVTGPNATGPHATGPSAAGPNTSAPNTTAPNAPTVLDRASEPAKVSPAEETPAEAKPGATAAASRKAPRRLVRRRTTVYWAIGAFLFGSAVSAVVASILVTQVFFDRLVEAGVADAPQVAVETGQNPTLTPCMDDAEVATGAAGAANTLIEIVWSNSCYAGWGRVTRYDGNGIGNTLTVALYPQTAPNGPDRQEVTEHDVRVARTPLVVRPSPDTLLCAEGSITVDGETIDLGEPLCM
ncbi:DUF2690 domain-containing protein [Microbacterium sp. P04]|uniref:DUF2690 domain-containing protein n=1 Tax=Microbacterium sp. P04 TaxID=3366947 RepID=UPI00374689BC